ncbi:MAG: hypothetical protein WBW48_00500, partial [Anaerolineae bacterium]
MPNTTFGEIWNRIVAHEGETFHTKNDKPFTYEIKGEGFYPSLRTRYRISKSNVTAQPEGIVVIARSTATKQSQPMAQGDCFASLAMTVEPNSTF